MAIISVVVGLCPVGAVAGGGLGAARSFYQQVLTDHNFLKGNSFAENLRTNHSYSLVGESVSKEVVEQTQEQVRTRALAEATNATGDAAATAGRNLNTRFATALKSFDKLGNGAAIGVVAGSFFGPVGSIVGALGGAAIGGTVQLVGDSITNYLAKAVLADNINLTILKNLPLEQFAGVVQGHQWMNVHAQMFWEDRGMASNYRYKLSDLEREVYSGNNPMSAGLNLFNLVNYGLSSYGLYTKLLNGGSAALLKLSSNFLVSDNPVFKWARRGVFTVGGGFMMAGIFQALGLSPILGFAVGSGVGYAASGLASNLAKSLTGRLGTALAQTTFGSFLSKFGAQVVASNFTLSAFGRSLTLNGFNIGGVAGGALGSLAGTYIAIQLGLPIGIGAAVGGAIGATAGAFIGGAIGGFLLPGAGIWIGSFIGSFIGSTIGTVLGAWGDKLFSNLFPSMPNPLSLITGLFSFLKLFNEKLYTIADYSKIALASLSVVSFIASVAELYSPEEFSDQGCTSITAEECTRTAQADQERNFIYAANGLNYSPDGKVIYMSDNYQIAGISDYEKLSDTEIALRSGGRLMVIANPGSFIYDSYSGRFTGATENTAIGKLFQIDNQGAPVGTIASSEGAVSPDGANTGKVAGASNVTQVGFCELDTEACN